MSAWGDVGATWGDGPPDKIRVNLNVTAADLADPDAFGARLEAALDAADPTGTLPVTMRMDVPAAMYGPPRLERALADLRQSLEAWHRGEVPAPSVIDATRAYLAALDADPDPGGWRRLIGDDPEETPP